ncbi:diacylglycerol kinase [Planosporangium mesophilum]|uniref:Diacylglycerol kinase n=1 Tax=Planosporangium mesophilum TaxID=689768 RepID=A0A8J3X328_9ACTN|nr:diacylglycerol kinase [Planosporangium mesophilum]NJC83050.1 diacylglycerol kinase [Planosporangium mesophilum]GII22458.1 diacylglycerol kinase [Planosporangium mesophilum]
MTDSPAPVRDVNDPGRTGELAVLANPAAGRGRLGRLLPDVMARLAAGGARVRLLEAPDAVAAEGACREAVAGGAAALVAVGGDGTVHTALQAVAGTPVPLGIVAAGTGNDFAAEVGLPVRPLDAAEAVADAFAAGRTRTVDLAHMRAADGRTRWYGAVLAAGFDAIVNERANAMRFPRGPRRYDVAIVGELARLRPRRYTLRLDGVAHTVDAVLVAVGNTASYGGGMRICPAADPTDGLLDVVVAGAVGRLTLMRIKPRVYAGTHVGHPMVTTFRARTVELEGEGIVGYADGERAFPLPVTIDSVPGALTLLG